MLKNFKGYSEFEITTKVSEFQNKDKFSLLFLEETVFFPESAGQIADKGVIIFEGQEYKILSLAIHEDKVVHKTELIENIQIGSEVIAKIDKHQRDLVSQNHSAAHLLFDTLREIYPTSVGKGYFNDETGLRIDMYIEDKINWSNIYELNNIVKRKMKTYADKEEFIVDAKTAKEVYNLSIEFNSKELEGDLRIVKFGDASIQLCSGTHVNSLIDIDEFVITSYESKGQSIYRFYAKTDIDEIQKVYKDFLYQDFNEISNLLKKYIKAERIYGKDQNLELLKYAWANLAEDGKKIDWVKYLKFNSLANDCRIQIPEYFVSIEQKKKDFLFKKYKDFEPTSTEEVNYFLIQENDLENKDLNFICDLILKNNPNSYVEIIDFGSKLYYCKSNSQISAIEKMNSHSLYNIKGGGNEKTAQGKIILPDLKNLLN
ncbi:alanine--tRNA ligase-related protein [Spiroplasma diminutum]|uniref:Alanyl-tRNA synthetase n=1 Tax=Spiroplasma diminutum CUAS-1 TaxID=1276221 RepID=S5MJX2_9MOLU|nr:alanine--tRNA ligase-related protein [Spiroplasma diminutum]AGR42255.1 alanyl-tRNA synthetase [Spiroplasma diminutum CUAS-1]